MNEWIRNKSWLRFINLAQKKKLYTLDINLRKDVLLLCAPEHISRYSNSLLVGRSGGSNLCGGGSFYAPLQMGLGAHPASCTMFSGYFSRGKAAWAWRWPPTPSSAEVKERLELHIYFPFGPSYSILVRNLHFMFIYSFSFIGIKRTFLYYLGWFPWWWLIRLQRGEVTEQ